MIKAFWVSIAKRRSDGLESMNSGAGEILGI